MFFTAFKYIFVEGGEQDLVGIGTLTIIGYRQTLKITLICLVGVGLYFLFLNIVRFFPTNLLYSGIIKKIPLKLTRLVSGILLALTGIPLILYRFDVSHPEILHWSIPPLTKV